ncbi:GMC family oxidoreductase [Spongiactinospora sp. TRM90649]|uniref:GMC oxidoreductase n=1 Tax=Spongiactinospora sp. TRM90649 TaxID=3031114 RepID=UPI0023FA3E48|nr:GMC family oxidoreductase [Spongiactinospora sp. TRM90649]MDF5757119.1 GMC family oxidoreductase [Spongiactinospora sp. TRM90649]
MSRYEHVDAIVVGSGFGGAVAAYRLAEAGQSVVVLERGRAYEPGGFARTPAQMSRAFWDPGEGLYGMFDVWGFRGFDSVVASGLGGGSLIYANVLLRKDEEWFVKDEPLPGGGYENWPLTRADLDPHYDAVEKMIGVSPYPLRHPAFTVAEKTRAMQDASAELGLDWRLAPLGVSFAPAPGAEPGIGLPIRPGPYPSLHKTTMRRTCRLCGECDIGCNDGAKNTLDHNYLAAAAHHGADLRVLHEVRAIRPRPGGGYEVDYLVHSPDTDDPDRAPRRTRPVTTMTCDRLVLGAGTYGTALLLLRARADLPGLSDAIGTRFCGNGDLLTFLLRATDRGRIRPLDASRGPVITSAIRLPDDLDGVPGSGRGAYIEDGGYPGFVDWMLEEADLSDVIARAARFLYERFLAFFDQAPDTNLSAELSELVGSGALSVSSLPLLGMGRDVPDGVLHLDGGRLDATWTTATSEAYFERVRKTMQRIADVLGAEYADNPVWFRKRIVTVHPVGGAPMGRHPGEGVCDSYGEVFGFPGLYIADGAAMPGPVGTNPSLTIAAMADRMCTRLLEGLEGTATSTPPGGGPVSAGMAAGGGNGAACDLTGTAGGAGQANREDRTSLSFTEDMKGFYREGVRNPGVPGDRFAFRLTITIDDVDAFLDDQEHLAEAEGWIDAAACGGRRLVERGWFNLFAPGGAPDRRLMRYRLYFTDDRDRPRTLIGWKNVFHGPPTDIWPATTTLYFRLLEGHVADGLDDSATIAGAGTLHIELGDFIRQLTSFRTEGPGGAAALDRFARFFAGNLWDVYGPG